jgi:hypothetical protein
MLWQIRVCLLPSNVSRPDLESAVPALVLLDTDAFIITLQTPNVNSGNSRLCLDWLEGSEYRLFHERV